jgi:hypothetical protein
MFVLKGFTLTYLISIVLFGGCIAVLSMFEFKILKVRELSLKSEGSLIGSCLLSVIFFILSLIPREKNQNYCGLYFAASTAFIVYLTFIKIFDVKGE